MWIIQNSDKVHQARTLHFAPEPPLAALLKGCTTRYVAADIEPNAGDVQLNIESIDLPSESLDLVVCSHVLEHVNDTTALRELFRVLTPGGIALLMFPVVEGWDQTYENSEHESNADRTIYFGQADHVRMYGSDVRHRIKSSGFGLEEFTAEEPNVARFGLMRGEKVFVATRPATGANSSSV